jgi:hypothetical protein
MERVVTADRHQEVNGRLHSGELQHLGLRFVSYLTCFFNNLDYIMSNERMVSE